MFMSLEAVTGFVAFLLGLTFGTFWAAPRKQTIEVSGLPFQLEIYFVLGFPLFVIVWSSLYFAGLANMPILRVVSLSVTSAVLIYMSYFFKVRLSQNPNAPGRLRLCITFGPVITGGLTGFAGLILVLGSYEFLSETAWWISLVFLFFTLFSAVTAFIFYILLALQNQTARPPPERRMAG